MLVACSSFVVPENVVSGSLTKLPVEYNTISSEAGVELETTAGQGTKGQFTLDVNDLFGTGDTLKLSAKGEQGAAIADLTLTFDKAQGTTATTFSGTTKEEQAQKDHPSHYQQQLLLRRVSFELLHPVPQFYLLLQYL